MKTIRDAHGHIIASVPEEPIAPELSLAGSLNIPNLITLTRLFLTLVVLLLIWTDRAWVVSTVIFVVAVSTDWLDGYLARKWNQITPLGRILDPFVDKIIIGGVLIFLTNKAGSGVSPWVTFIVIGREMFITALRSVLEGHGVDFSARWSGKIKMVLQSICVPLCLLSLSPWFQESLATYWSEFTGFRDVFVGVMVVATLYSGLEYVWRGWQLMQGRPA